MEPALTFRAYHDNLWRFKIPPWLSPTAPSTFIDAARSGAQIGLQQQAQAEQALEAAQRNSLGYAQISAQQAEAADRANAMRQDAAIRANDLLMGRNNQVAEQQKAASDLDTFRHDQLDQQGQLTTAQQALEAQKLKQIADLQTDKVGAMRYKSLAVQSAAAYKAANPDVSPAELISRFPGAFENVTGALSTPNKIAPLTKTVPEFSPGLQDQIFKQELINSQGGTNVDQAVNALRSYTKPSVTAPANPGAPVTTTSSAADALTQLPDLNRSAHDKCNGDPAHIHR